MLPAQTQIANKENSMASNAEPCLSRRSTLNIAPDLAGFPPLKHGEAVKALLQVVAQGVLELLMQLLVFGFWLPTPAPSFRRGRG